MKNIGKTKLGGTKNEMHAFNHYSFYESLNIANAAVFICVFSRFQLHVDFSQIFHTKKGKVFIVVKKSFIAQLFLYKQFSLCEKISHP